jgi:TonB dependent receptor/Carboxypeptidase regulatory-like domain/TonB-dependent Receptor Plug Domain
VLTLKHATAIAAGMVGAIGPTLARAQRVAITDTLSAASIIGEVVDAASGQPLAAARVTVRGTTRSASSAINGRFTLRAVPAGQYTLDVRRLGYLPFTQQNVAVPSSGRVTLRLGLTPVPFRLAEQTVTPGSFAFANAGPAIAQTLTRAEIQAAPFGEDVFRAVNRLPGLSSGDYGAQFSIRGGRQDEMLVLLDGLEIYEPFHLKDFNEGALSIFNVEAIDGVELLTGGFSAHYGDKRSGVMNIRSRTPTHDAPSVTAGLSLTGAQALGEGRFADRRGSWIISGRSGFAGALLRVINKAETRAPTYQDVFGSVRYAIHPNHILSLNLLHAADRYRFDINGTTGFNDSIRTQESANNTYGNSYLWAALQSQVGAHLNIRTLASTGVVRATRSGDERRTESGLSLYDVAGSRRFTVAGLRQDYSYQQWSRAIVEWGFDLRRLHANYDWVNRVTQNPDNPTPDTTGFYPRVTRRSRATNGTTVGAYISNRLNIAGPLTLDLGLRYDGATYTSDRDWSPRLHALYRLSDRNTLRFGWGQYRQRQGIADENAFTASNKYFASELSQQWSASVEHQFAGEGSLRVEAYHKTGSRLRPIQRNWKSGLNVFPESAEDRILVYPDATTSKGVEVYVERRFGSRVKVRSGYAFAVADERVSRIDHLNDPLSPPFAATHPAPQDQRHALNFDASYRLFNNWSLNGALTVHTGWPYTNEAGVPISRRNGTTDLVVRPDSLYGARLPLYQRIDLRVSRRRQTSHGEWRFFVEAINLLNHENVLGYDVFRVRDAAGALQVVRNTETWFSIVPSAGFSWSRRF